MEALEARQRKEVKEVQAQATRLKKAAGSNKKAKKDAVQKGEALKEELAAKHRAERAELLAGGAAADAGDGEEAGVQPAEGPEDAAAAAAPEAEAAAAPGTPKKSKAKKRREKKEREARERRARIEAAEPGEGESAREVEDEAIAALLRPKRLRVSQVRADGNCLFAAVAKQSTQSGQELRGLAADYLEQHADAFVPFLTSDSGDMLSPDEFTAYCAKMRGTAAWGGQCEITALSEVLGRPIVVYQAAGPVQATGEQFKPAEAIEISYHRHQFGLGAHYNAVLPVPAEGEGMAGTAAAEAAFEPA